MIDRIKLCESVKHKIDFDIIIIGKGASVDQIHIDSFKNKIIINANDSESIVVGDIGVFHHSWVLDRFKFEKPACKLYVTNNVMPNGVNSLYADLVQPNQEPELFINRFFDTETIWLEAESIINCLRIANELAESLNSRKKVYLFGFDFSMDTGFSKSIKDGFHGHEKDYVSHLIHTQELYLERLLQFRDRLKIDVIHIGNRAYSMYSVEAFNAMLATPVEFPKVAHATISELSRSYDVSVVAEITTNHFGDRDRLRAMIHLAKISGADYIKLQKRHVDTFYTTDVLNKPYDSPFGKSFRDYRIGLELTEGDFEWVDSYCRKIGIGWFASILDSHSFEFIKSFNCDIIKLPSTISEKKDYLAKVGKEWSGGVVISTGMTDLSYEDFIFNAFSACKRIFLLQCTSAYPASEFDAAIAVVRHYRDLSFQDNRISPGYSSHDIGSFCSQLSVAAGAKMIEKHVKLGKVTWAHFDDVAIDLSTNEFKDFVNDIRRAEKICGSEIKKISLAEHHKY